MSRHLDIDHITLEDATTIVEHFDMTNILVMDGGGVKSAARLVLRQKHLSVLDALIQIETAKKNQPKCRAF